MDTSKHEVIGIIVVDHGSRRAEANAIVVEVAALLAKQPGRDIVEPAHMELAEPSIQTALDRCIARGATRIVVHPFFLTPGRHWNEDIPRLTGAAAARHAGVGWLVTAPLGAHAALVRVIEDRVDACLACAAGQALPCALCEQPMGCGFRGTRPEPSG